MHSGAVTGVGVGFALGVCARRRQPGVAGWPGGGRDCVSGVTEMSCQRHLADSFAFIPSACVRCPSNRLSIQYTAYRKFNGIKLDYDGLGRSAKNNNMLYLRAWFLY